MTRATTLRGSRSKDRLLEADSPLEYSLDLHHTCETDAGASGTSDNTPNTHVVRDASGNFSAGNITASTLSSNRLAGTVGSNTFEAHAFIRFGTTDSDVPVYSSPNTVQFACLAALEAVL